MMNKTPNTKRIVRIILLILITIPFLNMIISSGSIGNILGAIVGYCILFLIVWLSTEEKKSKKRVGRKSNGLAKK